MDTRSDLDPELPDPVRDRAGASDRVRRTIEAREEAVAGRIELPSPEALQLCANDRVVTADQIAPPLVTELGRDLRVADDVREQDGERTLRPRLRDMGGSLRPMARPGKRAGTPEPSPF